MTECVAELTSVGVSGGPSVTGAGSPGLRDLDFMLLIPGRTSVILKLGRVDIDAAGITCVVSVVWGAVALTVPDIDANVVSAGEPWVGVVCERMVVTHAMTGIGTGGGVVSDGITAYG